jgi:HK97 family phage prohead protease
MTVIDLDVDAAPDTAQFYRAATIAEVTPSRREIAVIAVPYNEDAVIHEPGRIFVESFDPKAFAGVQRRITGRSKVTVNREHDAARTVGKVIALEPNHRDGLHATLRLTKGTALADETLTLAADDVLGASVSFSPMVDGTEWSPDRSRCRVTRAYLHHIALVPEPAYEGATVVAVRHDGAIVAVSATPWLDRVRAERFAARYGVELTP